MKLAWCTDIHLNFLEPDQLASFCSTIAAHEPDAIAITGDISEAPWLDDHLEALEKALDVPIYFVLGNHDYYRGSIKVVRDEMRALSKRSKHLRWLPAAGVIALGETALVGHDGWADARYGNFSTSRVMLNDYLHIDELAYLPRSARRARLNALGDEAASYLRGVLTEALARYEKVVVLTHVPPFQRSVLA